MRETLNNNLGFYNSAFLKIHVHSTEDLTQMDKISIQTEATYLHEYIHYLQDISSTYGLMNICAIVDYIKLVNEEAINDGTDEFLVPFDPFTSANTNVKANWELKSLYLGGGKGLNDVAKINSICKCSHPIVSNQWQINVEKVIIDFDDSTGRNFKYTVGAYCVSENMAYAIEKYIYPGILPTPAKMPYESIQIMSDYLLPGFSADPLNIVALCDACLLLFNPGTFVFDTLQEMSKTGFTPKKPEEVYDFVYKNVKFNYNGNTTIQQLLISTASDAICQLGDYFTTSIFKDNKSWIKYVVTSAIDIRQKYPCFILDIIRNGTILNGGKVNNKPFVLLLHKLGSPIVVNDCGDMTFIQPKPTSFELRPEYLWVFHQIYNIYKNELDHQTYKCEMIDYCDLRAGLNQVAEYTDERCRYDPWTRSKDTDQHPCLFGHVWKTWGLMNEYPQTKEDEA